MKRLSLFVAPLLLQGALLAQSTWIVDTMMRPGAHYPDLPQAVAGAAPGDTLLLRASNFPYNTTVIDKALRVLGVSSNPFPASSLVRVKGRWRIRDVGSGQTVVVSNLQLAGPAFVTCPHGIECVNNSGSIHFEKVEMRGGGLVNGITRFEDCADLSFHGCRLEAYDTEVTFLRSRARLVDCDVFSSFPNSVPGWGISQTADAMRIVDSHVTMARSQAIGVPRLGNQSNFRPRAGAHLESGTLVACADSRFLGGDSGCQPPCFTSGIYGSGTLVIDPTVTYTHVLDPALTVIQRHVPALRMDLAFRGLPVEVGVVGPAQGFAMLALGTPLHTPITWPIGELGLEPRSIVPLHVGALGPTGQWNVVLPVWPGLPLDDVFAFQAGVIFPNGALELTTPVSFSVQLALGGPMP